MSANFNFNKTIIGGRLTADPELKSTGGGVSVTSFTVAVNRRKAKEGEQQADFLTCVAWRQNAEFLCKYFKKGSSVCVVGQLQNRSWTDQQGQKRYSTEIIVDEIYFCDAKSGAGQDNGATYVPDAYTAKAAPALEEIDDEADLPF